MSRRTNREKYRKIRPHRLRIRPDRPPLKAILYNRGTVIFLYNDRQDDTAHNSPESTPRTIAPATDPTTDSTDTPGTTS
jgi:hypothetical protein